MSRHCVRMKNTPAGKRCAKYSGTSTRRRRSGSRSGHGGPSGQHCERYKYVRTKSGKRVRRCADFAGGLGGATLSGRHCTRMGRDKNGRKHCKKYSG